MGWSRNKKDGFLPKLCQKVPHCALWVFLGVAKTIVGSHLFCDVSIVCCPFNQ